MSWLDRLFDRRPGESPLHRRLRKHGTRGMVKVHSPEGTPVSTETARKLRPA